MRAAHPGVGLAIMVATTLHSVATGNLLPASVQIICVDNNMETITKLMDRGTRQAFGLVTDCQFFLKELAARLEGTVDERVDRVGSGRSGRIGLEANVPRLTVEGFAPVEVVSGKRLVRAIEEDAGVDVLHACGGNARCTTCRVEFIDGEPASHDAGRAAEAGGEGADRCASVLPDPLRSRHDRPGDQPPDRQRSPGCRSDAGIGHNAHTGLE